MKRITPQQQLLCELNKLNSQDADNLCIALVCLLRFGMKAPVAELLGLKES